MFPVRVGMELVNLVLLFKGNWKHPVAAISAIFWVFLHPLQILRRRRETQRLRVVSDWDIDRLLFNRSVVFGYFVRGVKTVRELGA